MFLFLRLCIQFNWCDKTFRLDGQYGTIHLTQDLFSGVADEQASDSGAAQRAHDDEFVFTGSTNSNKSRNVSSSFRYS